ncbi:hypothetical protein Avbf_07115 [Armadillidium vulgare]|nr:hypothetical protein Avbf_07115 [Armadillidium vulgare]
MLQSVNHNHGEYVVVNHHKISINVNMKYIKLPDCPISHRTKTHPQQPELLLSPLPPPPSISSLHSSPPRSPFSPTTPVNKGNPPIFYESIKPLHTTFLYSITQQTSTSTYKAYSKFIN